MTTEQLAAITSLDLESSGITALKAGDFAGLSALTRLDLDNNQISTLPTGIFSGLSALTRLYLSNNPISTLPAGAFSGLSALKFLYLSSNQISTLPAGAFSGLSKLTLLNLSSNQISTLPAGAFSGLSALTGLGLSNNQISTLPAGAFSGLSALRFLYMPNNQISTLPAGAFSGLSALTRLDLADNQISTLPTDIFFGLSTLRFLFLDNNQISTLPAGAFSGLSALRFLYLPNNQLSTLPAGTFSGLSALTRLDLADNQLSTLPAGAFSGLSALTRLDLAGNPLDAAATMLLAGLPSTINVIANSAPFASAGADATVTKGATVTLDGSASSDLEGDTLAYSWTHSHTGITLSGETTAMPTFTAPDQLLTDLVLTFSLVVNDGTNNSQPDTVTITVVAAAMAAALAKISAYAQTDGSPVPTVMDYSAVGVTGVTIDNLDIVNAAVLASTAALASTSAVQTLVDPAINMAAALAKISAYAQTDGSPAPTVMDYSAVGVTGVTIDNLDIVNAAVLASTAALASTSAVQTLVDPAINMAAALAKISAYAQTDGSPVPTVMDYTDAGITGVNADNLAIVNAAVLASTAALASTSAVQTLVDPAINMAAALAKISAYAQTDGSPVPTVMDYTDAGITGVNADNLAIVNAAVLASTAALTSTSAVQTLVDPAIMAAAALARISAYAQTDGSPAPTPMDYMVVGIIGATTGNLDAVNVAVLASTAALASMSAVQTLVDPAINMAAALAKISAYAQTDGSPVPTVMDYSAVGVTGVTMDNLPAVNAVMLASSATEADTTAKIQALVDPAIMMVAALAKISAYAQTDGSPVPTVMDYTDAGVTGVTIDNLDIVNAAVLASTAALASTSAVQTLVDPAINMAAALAKISAYAQTDGSPVPTVMDYSAVGVTGVTIDNLDIVNAAVAAVSATEADTTDKIQALVTKAVEIVDHIKQLNTAIMPRLTQAMLGTTLTSISSRLDSAFSGATQSSRGQLDGVSLGAQPIVLASFLQKLPSYVDSLQEGNTNWRRMLANSSFTLSPQDAQSGSAKGLTVWGIGDYSSLGDKDNSLDWDGEVFTVQLGIDKQLSHNLLVGGLVSWSDGDVDADLAGIERSSYKHRMISVHPYLAWSGKHAQLWGSLGYGQGKLKIGLGNNNPSLDTRLVSMVAGGEGRLSNRLSLKSDIALAQTDIDGSNLSTQQDTDSQRLRLLLKADLISRGHYTATLEAGARYDNGDGDSGLGAVLDASMAYNNPAKGLTVGAKLHTLLGRDDYSEWGLSGLLELATKANGRGLAFSLSPSYSLATQDDSQAIWQENQLDSANNLYAADQQMQLDTRLSYGLLAFATQGLLTPYSEVTFGDTNSYRLGIHWQGNNRLDLDLFGEHSESRSRQDDQAIMLKGKFHF